VSENDQPDRGKTPSVEEANSKTPEEKAAAEKESLELKLRTEAVGEIYDLAIELYPNWNRDRLNEHIERVSRLDLGDLQSMLGDYQEKLKRKSKSILTVDQEEFCYACGTAWAPGYITCIACGSTDRGVGTARPTVHVEHDKETFMGPWELLPWPRTGVVGMFGGPGAGKSSLAAMIRPKIWLTKEQVPKPVGEMFRRLWGGDFMPQVHVVKDARDVKKALSIHYQGPAVLDSATALKLKDGLEASEIMVEWAQERNERGLIIIQVNKAGESAGYMEIPHLVDAVINISPDPWGVRSFRVNKSRWSPLGATYWGFNEHGQVETPDFPASYSVEGTPGNYWLHPFPIRGSKWAGLLAAMSADDRLAPRCASAAVRAPYMPHGFVEPMDVHERRVFALQHGLTWIKPEDFQPQPNQAPPLPSGE
jgi:hypothetical protein